MPTLNYVYQTRSSSRAQLAAPEAWSRDRYPTVGLRFLGYARNDKAFFAFPLVNLADSTLVFDCGVPVFRRLNLVTQHGGLFKVLVLNRLIQGGL